MSAPPVDESSSADGKLPDTETPPDAINLNVGGKELAGPERGFGQLWRKTYRVRLPGAGATPREVIARWKSRFSDYWPEGNDFYGSRPRIEEGEVAVINLTSPVGAPIATGIAVFHADAESFSFVTPQGHIFAGIIHFSAFRDKVVVAPDADDLPAGRPVGLGPQRGGRQVAQGLADAGAGLGQHHARLALLFAGRKGEGGFGGELRLCGPRLVQACLLYTSPSPRD